MIFCDVCGKETKEMRIVPQKYRINGIKEMCVKCSIILYVKIDKIEVNSIKVKKNDIQKVIKKNERK